MSISKGEALANIGKLHGSTSRAFQRIVRMNCEKDDLVSPLEAVARVLLSEGISQGLIPPAVGIKTPELLERSEQSFWRAAGEYREKGGVLLAKEYVRALSLVASMAELWMASFAPPIPVDVKLPSLSEEELNQRLTLVAQAVLEEFAEASDHPKKDVLRYVQSGSDVTLSVIADRVEGMCKESAKKMLEVFLTPNETVHEKAHGAKP